MISAPKLPSTDEEEVEEEEVEGLIIQWTEPVENIQITQSTLTTLKVKGGEVRDGRISPIFNVTIARSMPNMNKNAERSNQTRTMVESMSLK